MSKYQKKKNNGKKTPVTNTSVKSLPCFGKYSLYFEKLEIGKTVKLIDKKSSRNTYAPIKSTKKEVYKAEPDGKIIPPIKGQKKCDFLIYAKNESQVCFLELKGMNISIGDDYNPYDQIIETINYFKNDLDLKDLVDNKIEKHAFIISPGRQKIPSGVDKKERQLLKYLIQININKPSSINELIHYVKVTAKDRYSNCKGQIICSPSDPINIPF